MKKAIFHYCAVTDILFIALSGKRLDIGEQEYQDGVVLFRDPKTNEVVNIEIIDFSVFEHTAIQVSRNQCFDMKKPFKLLHFITKLFKIRDEDPEFFNESMKILGFELKKDPFQLPVKSKDIPIIQMRSGKNRVPA